MPRVLVLAYYFPPLGGSGVQRVAKLVKYLPSWGWQAEVVTAHPAAYIAQDEGLREEVERAGVRVHATRSLDPTRLFGHGTVGLPSEGKRRRISGLSQALFIPDNRIGWLPFAYRTGSRLLASGRFDAVLASAPPYTGLLAGALLSRRHDIPMLVDLRDDWLGNPRHIYPTSQHRTLHATLERFVLRTASAITVISEEMREALLSRHPGIVEKTHLVPQGFDPEDFVRRPPQREKGKMRLLYTGVFYDAQRPDAFLKGLARFFASMPDAEGRVEAHFAGLVPDYFESLVAQLRLQNVVRYLGYLPHHEVVQHQYGADVLWMTVGDRPGAEGISTGKLFEYVGTGRPVLGLVPEGTAKRALRSYGASWTAPPNDVPSIAAALRSAFVAWERDSFPLPDQAYVLRHDRRLLAGEVAGLLRTISRT